MLTNHLLELIREKDKRYRVQFAALAQQIAAQRDVFNVAIHSVEIQAAAALAANEKAISVAQVANEKRLDSVNEFRAVLTDQAAHFITRNEVESMEKANAVQLQAIEKRLNLSQGRSTGLSSGWAYLLAALGALDIIFRVVQTMHAH